MKGRAPRRPEPARLSRDPALGALIDRANAAYRARLDEAAAFQRLSERLVPRRKAPTWQRVTLGASLSFAAAATLMLVVARDRPSSIAFGPEFSTGRRAVVSAKPDRAADEAASRSVTSAAREESPLPQDPLAHAEAALEASSVGPTERSAARELEDSETSRDKPAREGASRESAPDDGSLRAARGVVRESRAEALDAAHPEPTRDLRAPKSTRASTDDGAPAEKQLLGGTTAGAVGSTRSEGAPIDTPTSVAPVADGRVNCLDMIRRGEPVAAERCFADRAAGTGLSAEMALYEIARLRRVTLQDGAGALEALDEYRRRFPQGSLRHEVSITRVELLSELGRSREALSESEALLGSASGQERAAELHLLRGNVFRRDLHDWKSAAAEYAKAEGLGGALAPEALRLRGMSLEGMGDVEGALAAYWRYLAGKNPTRKAEVTRRIEALMASRAAQKETSPTEDRTP